MNRLATIAVTAAAGRCGRRGARHRPQLQALAPEEIQADVAKVNEDIATIGEVLAANDWDVAALDTDPAMQALIADPAFQTASANIDSYCLS